MAAKLPCAAMQSHARVAVYAGSNPAAGIAKQTRRVAAAIQEYDDLSAGLEVLIDGLHDGCRYPLLGCVPAQIDERHSRRSRRAGALRQQVFDVAAACGILQGFERWCGGAQDDGNIGTAGAHDGEVPRRISKTFVLLVRGVMLFVDDDKGQPGQRREHRGARSDDDARVTAVRRAPRVATLTIGQGRMHDRNAAAETVSKALDQLRRQGDLRYEDQGLAACCNGRGDDLQVHLGLAAARHPVEQVRVEVGQCGENGIDGLLLRTGEREPASMDLHWDRGRRLGGRRIGAARRDPAARRQTLEEFRLESLADFSRRGLGAICQPGEQGALLRCALRAWLDKFLLPLRGETKVLGADRDGQTFAQGGR